MFRGFNAKLSGKIVGKISFCLWSNSVATPAASVPPSFVLLKRSGAAYNSMRAVVTSSGGEDIQKGRQT